MKWYLDFGHGGKDPGAVGKNGTKESDIVLKIGMGIKHLLEKANETVVTTRTSDTYLTLSYRTNKANKENCDYFISFHMNSFINLTKGCEVWVYNSNSKLYLLGNNIVFNLSKALNTPNRGVKTSKSFYVLKHTKMPALLIEIDFISNPVVESVCLSDDYIKTTAYTIASTLLAFVNKKL